MTRASRRPPFACAAGVWAALILGVGCAHETVADRQLHSLEEGLNKENARLDRETPPIDPVKIQEEEQAKLAAVPPPTLPSHDVVGIGMGGDPARNGEAATLDGEDVNDTSPRPVIRVVGTGIVRRGAHGAGDHIDETLPDEVPEASRIGPPIQVGAPPSSALDPNAKRAYDSALALVNAHDYDRALEAFAAFLVKWPDHPNADNAMYWRGECYYAKGEIARAAEEFDGALKRFPMGSKVPDCLLKLGLCEQKLGNPGRAQAYFDRLAHDFPRSEPARRIPTDRAAPHDGGRAGPQENP